MPGRGLTNEAVIRAVTEVLRQSRTERVEVTDRTRFDTLGVESFEMIEILIAIEQTTGCVIADSELAHVETVRDLAACETVALPERGSS